MYKVNRMLSLLGISDETPPRIQLNTIPLLRERREEKITFLFHAANDKVADPRLVVTPKTVVVYAIASAELSPSKGPSHLTTIACLWRRRIL
jgi:hypothetical protein